MFTSVSEKEIIDAVQAVRASVQDRYDQAARNGWREWVTPPEKYNPTMKNLQRAMSHVFDHNHRDLRLRVTEIVLGVDGLSVDSYYDLCFAEMSALIAACDELPKFNLVLDAIAMSPRNWEMRLGTHDLKRPVISAPDPEAPPEPEDDGWEVSVWSGTSGGDPTWNQPALMEDDEW